MFLAVVYSKISFTLALVKIVVFFMFRIIFLLFKILILNLLCSEIENLVALTIVD